MEALLSSIVSAILQVVVFSLIPLIAWAVTARGREPVLSWLGPGEGAPRVLGLALVIALLNLGLGLSETLVTMLGSEGTVSGRFAGQAFGGIVVATVLVEAWFKTGLSEEIFFRGFLARRLIARFGFRAGNAGQALIFGAIHLPIVAVLPSELQTAPVFLFLVGDAHTDGVGDGLAQRAAGRWIHPPGLGDAWSRQHAGLPDAHDVGLMPSQSGGSRRSSAWVRIRLPARPSSRPGPPA